MRQPFWIVDVFAEEKWAGNQLAVVCDAGGLKDEVMQRIARETNFSETTFVTGERDGGFEVRIFTPSDEIPFAGHPTLGTAWVLRHERLAEPTERVLLHLGIGEVPVRFEQESELEVAWMEPGAPELGRTLDGGPLAEVLGVGADDLHPDLPVREVRIGIPFTFVPLRGLGAVRRARFLAERYERLAHEDVPPMFFVFCPEAEGPGNQIHARMFAPTAGVPEDPATGSANACLAAYLLEHRVLGDGPVRARVEQGVEMGRPSLLRLRASREEGRVRVEVGGRVFLSARGELA
jgi:trans-2,3-dihydro-3-hydroxyanthranilate isomerase